MSISNQEAKYLDVAFKEALENYNKEQSKEAAMQVKAAWDSLLELMLRENNLSDCLGNDTTDWQIGNWANDTEEALYNAHLYPEVIQVNEQILKIQWSSSRQLFYENAKRDIADAYAYMGEIEKSCQLYQEYIEADPLWGWGWIGYFRLLHDHDDPRFEEVLENLYTRIKTGENFRDKGDLCLELCDEYARLGNQERADYFLKQAKTERHRSNNDNIRQEKKIASLIKPKKIYPNDPCPCGSGKKYKKCHGR